MDHLHHNRLGSPLDRGPLMLSSEHVSALIELAARLRRFGGFVETLRDACATLGLNGAEESLGETASAILHSAGKIERVLEDAGKKAERAKSFSPSARPPPSNRGALTMRVGNYRAALVLGYRGHGRRFGLIPFGNGYTLRVGRVALHVWRLGANDRGQR